VCVKDMQGQVCVLVIVPLSLSLSVCVFTDLPHSNDSICNEDEEDDEGLYEGSDSLLTILK